MSENEGCDAIVDPTAVEFRGSHHSLAEPIEIWFYEGVDCGWRWCETSMPDSMGHGPFGTSKDAFEAAAKHFEELDNA